MSKDGGIGLPSTLVAAVAWVCFAFVPCVREGVNASMRWLLPLFFSTALDAREVQARPVAAAKHGVRTALQIRDAGA